MTNKNSFGNCIHQILGFLKWMLFLKNDFVCLFVFLCCLFKKRGTGHHIFPIAHMLVRVQLGGSVPSFYHAGSGDQTLVTKLGISTHLAILLIFFNLETRAHNLSCARQDSTTMVPLRPQLMLVRNCHVRRNFPMSLHNSYFPLCPFTTSNFLSWSWIDFKSEIWAIW